jgi:hypothetical protein
MAQSSDLFAKMTDAQFAKAIKDLENSKRIPRKIYLSWSDITYKHIKALAQTMFNIEGVQELYLSGTKIGDKGINFIITILKTSRSLRKLDISYIGMSAAGVVRLIEALKGNYGLLEINIIGNEFPKGIENSLNAMMHNNTTFCRVVFVERRDPISNVEEGNFSFQIVCRANEELQDGNYNEAKKMLKNGQCTSSLTYRLACALTGDEEQLRVIIQAIANKSMKLEVLQWYHLSLLSCCMPIADPDNIIKEFCQSIKELLLQCIGNPYLMMIGEIDPRNIGIILENNKNPKTLSFDVLLLRALGMWALTDVDTKGNWLSCVLRSLPGGDKLLNAKTTEDEIRNFLKNYKEPPQIVSGLSSSTSTSASSSSSYPSKSSSSSSATSAVKLSSSLHVMFYSGSSSRSPIDLRSWDNKH